MSPRPLSTTKLVFGYTTDSGLASVVVTVRFDADGDKEEVARGIEREMARQTDLRGKKNLTLLASIGIPDICVVLDGSSVAAVYCRNYPQEPLVEVIDLAVRNADESEEYRADEQAQVFDLNEELEERHFRFLPHWIEEGEEAAGDLS